MLSARLPRPVVFLSFAGSALSIALGTTFEIYFFTPMDDALRDFNVGVFCLGQVASFLVYAILSRVRTVRTQSLFSWQTIVLGAVGLLLMMTGLRLGGPTSWLLTGFGSLLQGHQRAALTLLWLEVFTVFPERDLLVALAASHLLSAALSFGLSFVSAPLVVEFALWAIPMASYALYLRGGSHSSSVFTDAASQVRWSFPYRPVVFIAAFLFVNEFVRSFLSSDAAIYTLVGVFASVAPVVVAALVAFDRLSLGSLYRISLPLLIGGVLCLYPLKAVFLAAFLTNAAYALFHICTITLLCLISRRYCVNPLWLFGITEAAADLAGVLGEAPALAGIDPLATGLFGKVALVVFVPLSIYVFITFLSSSDMLGAWGMRYEGDEESATMLQQREREGCARLARHFALTRREEDVLVLLVQGKTVPEIENELFVSGATVKTHVQHIYKKLDVHNRQELQDHFARHTAAD